MVNLQRVAMQALCFVLLLVSGSLAAQEDDYRRLSIQVVKLNNQGNYTEGIPVAQQAVAVAEKTFGYKHENVALMVFYLGVFQRHTGHLAEAESLFKKSLTLYEELKEPDDIAVGSVLSHLASLYKAEGKATEAEALYKRSLAIAEKKWGPDRVEITDELGNLARFYVDTGRYSDAELVYKRSLTIKEAALGSKDPAVARCLAKLAEVYRSEKNYPDAESMYSRALSIEELNLDKNSLELVDWLDMAGEVFREDNKYADAEGLFVRALSIVELSPRPDDNRLAHSLTELGGTYSSEKKFAMAEPLFIRALSIREKAVGTDPRSLATTLCNLAMLYATEGQNAKGAPFFHRALDVWGAYLKSTYPEFAASLNALESLYANVGRYHEIEIELNDTISDVEKLVRTTSPVERAAAHARFAWFLENESKYTEAEPLYRRALMISNEALGTDDVNIGIASNNLAQVLRKEGKYSEAEALDRRALDIVQKSGDPASGYAAAVLSNLGVLVQHQGQYREAETLFRRSLDISEKIPNNPDLPTILFNFGKLCFEEDRFEEAERLYKRSLEALQGQASVDSVQYIRFQAELAEVYAGEGKYAESEKQARSALHALEKAVGPDHPSVAYSALVLAETYARQSRFSEADEFQRRAVDISKRTLGTYDPDLALALRRMAKFYDLQGNFIAAEPLAEEALRINEAVFGQNHPSVTKALNQLAILYREHKRLEEAETLCRRALKNSESFLPADQLLIAASLTGLAGVYKDQARFADAERLYQRALNVSESTSADPTALAALVSNLGTIYYDEGKLSQAEPLLKRALGIIGNTAGVDDPDLATITSTLANLYYQKGQPEQAQPAFAQSLRNLSHQFKAHFSYMSEKQRLMFLRMVFNRFPVFFGFCLTYYDRYPGLVGGMYNVLLWEKGLVARSIASQRVNLVGDADSTALRNQLTAKEIQLARLRTTLPTDRTQWEKTLNQLENETEAMQRELARRSGRTAEEERLAAVEWRDVQKVLEKDEAAVEFVRFSGETKTGQPEKFYYVALVLTPEMSIAPTLVPLGPATVVEGPAITQYRRAARLDKKNTPIDGPTLYECLWKPLEPILAGKKKIYVSTDGVLNQVSLAVVSDAQGLLIQRYHITLVSSTSDLLRERHRSSMQSAVLIGNPKFDLSEADYRASLSALKTHEGSPSAPAAPENKEETQGESTRSGARHVRSQDRQGGVLEPLPGTREELRLVRDALETNGWKVDVLTEQNALKEALVAVSGPRILHVATHGYFLGDQEKQHSELADNDSELEDLMLRSGLYLAGANRILKGEPPIADLGNGVLTAYEATGLNLQGTELVILSACDTGLGEVRNGEGVFGLRRALEEAGAEAVLMSMWSVPDIETQELMTSFYEKWLAGSDKQDALRDAELDERKKVKERWGRDRPDLWGAFVLVGH